MKTTFHWKIIIAFVVTPILSLALFVMLYYLVLTDENTPPTGVLVFMTIFGITGLWLLLTVIFRAKRIQLKDDRLIMFKLFMLRQYSYNLLDVEYYNVSLKQENPFMEYEILQFKTKDNKSHSIVSYEFQQFDEIMSWITRSGAHKKQIGLWEFFKNEYGVSLTLAMIIYVVLIIPLL